MSPRALTEQEKTFQRQRLMATAQELVLAHGIRGVSVDDIVRATRMAKGSFYSYFGSKEALMMQLVWDIYQGFVDQATALIRQSSPETLRYNMGVFIRAILSEPDKVFFFRNHQELGILLAGLKPQEKADFSALELEAFGGLIMLAGKNTAVVRPGVVHNYIHAMYFALNDGAMAPDCLAETLEAMLEGLLCYVFGPEGAV